MERETAMKILKELHNKSLFAERTALETIIPELKESEDKRIRKALIEMVHDTTGDELWVDYNVHKEDALAWLEKQCYTKKDVDDAYLKGISDAKNELEKQGTPAKLSEEEQNSFAKGVLSNCALSFINYLDAHSYEGKMCVSNGECEDIENAFHNAMWDRLHRYYCKYIEKQDEQKPILDFKASNFYVSKVDGKIHDMTYNSTDKVEPKFKIGDWIVNDYCMGRVIEITNDAYLLDTEQGIPFSCEHNVHLWTIKDAKDGDMLIDKNYMGESPFIFKETKPSNIKTDVPNPLTVLGYCGIGGAGFTKSSGWGDTANCIYYPATKEQRELLFKKMNEAGYEWDAEKKELKLLITNGGDFEPQQEWSEEDKEMFDRIDESLYYYATKLRCEKDYSLADAVKEEQSWLFSLKNRIQPQPQQEWSEEDKRMCQETIDWFEKKCFPYALEEENPARESIKWLKSLKDRIGG